MHWWRQAGKACRGTCESSTKLSTAQAAAEEVSREHPGGIDFLIVNAAISGAYTIGIETCAFSAGRADTVGAACLA